jgi:hypothetical protein
MVTPQKKLDVFIIVKRCGCAVCLHKQFRSEQTVFRKSFRHSSSSSCCALLPEVPVRRCSCSRGSHRTFKRTNLQLTTKNRRVTSPWPEFSVVRSAFRDPARREATLKTSLYVCNDGQNIQGINSTSGIAVLSHDHDFPSFPLGQKNFYGTQSVVHNANIINSTSFCSAPFAVPVCVPGALNFSMIMI